MKKKVLILSAALSAAMLLSGCSFSPGKIIDKIIGRNKQLTETVVDTTEQTADEAKMIDDSLEAPVFTNDLTGSMSVIQGAEFRLETEATVSDGGTVTYQWYRNNVNANGGGTVIGGATDTVVEVDTTEAQTVYYYVVATNAHGDSVNMSTSGVYEITVWPEGEWKQDDRGWQYLMEDGTFPADTKLQADNMLYVINAEGYRTDDGIQAPETAKGDEFDNAEAEAKAAEKAKAAEQEKAAAKKKAAQEKKAAAAKAAKAKAAEEQKEEASAEEKQE